MDIMITLVIAALTCGAGIAGLYVQKVLPDEHKSDASRGTLQQVAGLVTLLLALVLGTVIGVSYGFFSTQRSELEAFSAQLLQLDQALAQYGPETQPARAQLKDSIVRGYELFWGGGNADASSLTVANPLARMQAMNAYLGTLEPKTDAQKQAVGKAGQYVGLVTQSRLLMSLQVASRPVSWPLLSVLVFWAVALFFAFGILSRINATVVTALAFGACSVAFAMFLILELGQPYTGLFRVSPAALQQTIEFLDK